MSGFLTGVLVAASALASLPCPRAEAQATQDVGAAADAFASAQQAELRGEWEQAAHFYALADQILPSAEALRSAARAAQRAGLNASAATYAAALLARLSGDRESRALANEILEQTESELGRVRVRCSTDCRVLIEGRLATAARGPEHVVYTRPGERRFSVSFGDAGNSEEQTLVIEAGTEAELTFEGPDRRTVSTSDASTDAPPGGGGIAPWFFVTGAVLTAGMGALVIWSGLEVLDSHADYDRRAPDAQAAFDGGRELETRTNVLITVTSALAITTFVLALFTDWDGEPSDAEADLGAPLLHADDRGVVVGWSRSFR